MLREMANGLDPNRVTFKVVTDPVATGGGIIVSLTPMDETSAIIVAHADANFGGVDLVFGKNTVLEIPSEGHGYTDLPCLDEVRALCSSVMQGDFSEDVWTQGTDLIRTKGNLKLGGKELRLHHWQKLFWNPFKKITRTKIVYAPYAGSQSDRRPNA